MIEFVRHDLFFANLIIKIYLGSIILHAAAPALSVIINTCLVRSYSNRAKNCKPFALLPRAQSSSTAICETPVSELHTLLNPTALNEEFVVSAAEGSRCL